MLKRSTVRIFTVDDHITYMYLFNLIGHSILDRFQVQFDNFNLFIEVVIDFIEVVIDFIEGVIYFSYFFLRLNH